VSAAEIAESNRNVTGFVIKKFPGSYCRSKQSRWQWIGKFSNKVKKYRIIDYSLPCIKGRYSEIICQLFKTEFIVTLAAILATA
jgi:hypothetical protein